VLNTMFTTAVCSALLLLLSGHVYLLG